MRSNGLKNWDAEDRIVLGTIFLAIIAEMANFLYFRSSLLPELDYLTDFHARLLGIRLFISCLFAIAFVGILAKKMAGKICGLASLILVIVLYISWYFEKFRWLSIIGAHYGTNEYSTTLHEVGYFRGANEIDYALFLVAIGLFFWVLARPRRIRG